MGGGGGNKGGRIQDFKKAEDLDKKDGLTSNVYINEGGGGGSYKSIQILNYEKRLENNFHFRKAINPNRKKYYENENMFQKIYIN